jgi:hypothetical protein
MNGDRRRLVLREQHDEFAGSDRLSSLVRHHARDAMRGDGGVDGGGRGVLAQRENVPF